MRVISGKYKGKYLKGFDIDGTRPTMDRVKESLFGIIQNNIYDSICLDLFAGSGSLGIEALSNGAKKCYFNDSNNEMIKILKLNLITPSIKKIIDNNLLNDNGLIICEYETEVIKCDLNILKEKKYGSKKI